MRAVLLVAGILHDGEGESGREREIFLVFLLLRALITFVRVLPS